MIEDLVLDFLFLSEEIFLDLDKSFGEYDLFFRVNLTTVYKSCNPGDSSAEKVLHSFP